MSKFVRYICTRETFRPAESWGVRWLDRQSDFALMQEYWAAKGIPLTEEEWSSFDRDGYTYCATAEGKMILAIAAVWRCSDSAWEVAAVSTKEGFRQRGLAKSVVSFATRHILEAGKLATCTTGEENLAMRKTVEAVGYTPLP